MKENTLSSLSETVKQLLIDGAMAKKMDDDYMVSITYNKGSSYIVARLSVPFVSADVLLVRLLLNEDCVKSLRFY